MRTSVPEAKTQRRVLPTLQEVRGYLQDRNIALTCENVELRGFEPLTFCMPCRRATSCAIAPHARRRRVSSARGPASAAEA